MSENRVLTALIAQQENGGILYTAEIELLKGQALIAIAQAIENLAEAVRSTKEES